MSSRVFPTAGWCIAWWRRPVHSRSGPPELRVGARDAGGFSQATALDSGAVRTCPHCGNGNDDDARFCANCGATLTAACPNCGAKRPEGARFCPSCGFAFEAASGAPGQERRVVTVLFVDVTGSTGLGEQLDPERLREVMDAYFTAMREEIQAEGGTVEKFIGDAVMAAFGVPVAHEDDPSRALRAALRIRERLRSLNDELQATFGITLQVRTGVNTGEVLATMDPKPGEAMVTGDAVNAAARLEQAAEPGGILVSERTARASRGFRFRELAPLEVRGKTGALDVLELQEATGGSERGIPGLRAPLVGRAQELALLRTVYERSATERRPNLVTIYGDPGVGKSRLTNEFIGWVERQIPSPIVVHGRCLPYGDGVTYWPLGEILKSYAGIRDSDPPSVTLERIHEAAASLLTTEVSMDATRTIAALAYTVGVEDPAVPFATFEPRHVRAETHSAWRSFFSALALSGPVVVVVEDIHWADPALLDLLEELAERVKGGVLFVCPSRPELTARRPSWGGGRRNYSSVSLEPLTPEEADRLVGLLLTVEDLPRPVHDRILERAEGNPFFLEEIVRQLIDEQLIVRSGDRWRAISGIEDVEIPDTVQGVLAARIDLLAPAEKRTLQSAAVVGRIFWPSPVALLLNGEAAELEHSLGHLESRELVLERLGSAISGEQEYTFKHVLTHDVAYESLPRRVRAHAHATVAEWIERTAGDRKPEFVELLAHHYAEAHRAVGDEAGADAARVEDLRVRAFRALVLAAEDADNRFAIQKALCLAERALAIAETPLERAEALERLGRTARNDYRGDLAWDSMREAADLRAGHVPDAPLAIARVCGWAVQQPTRWPGSMSVLPPESEVREYLDLGFANVGEEESEELVRLLTARAFAPWAFAGGRLLTDDEIDDGHAAGERAVSIATRLRRPDLASSALDALSSIALVRGQYVGAIPIVERRLALTASLEDPWELGDIHGMASWIRAYSGLYVEAVAAALDGLPAEGSGAEGPDVHRLAWAGFAEFSLGNWDRVIDTLLPRVLSILGERRKDPPYFAIHILGPVAIIQDARGDPGAAEWAALLHRTSEPSESQRLTSLPWLAWLDARHGRASDAWTALERFRSISHQGSRPLIDQVRAIALAEGVRWDLVPDFLADSRAYTESAGTDPLGFHLDRLEGRAALAAGDIDVAVRLLEAASDGANRLHATWERACTDISLAEALIAAGRADEARVRTQAALDVVTELRSRREIERARSVLANTEQNRRRG
jgi:class 3 adenylate cyclase